ncbi:serine dehydratase [Sorangium cellulosum]|uniref:L-serine dehydratase n=1 Tax=Sorangium cellulosum TaxID=56 RepID=A0A4P2PWW5_SORCE|nr:L-serine ammonia-lyase [Sorangium cellulosum]AUX21220.1 serine dehydratase [Sorangium cellulosum]
MAVTIFDLFKIGIGPSSSHTVGPMRAARLFAVDLDEAGLLGRTAAVKAELFGSLGATGRGHGSDRAVLLGLMGETPDEVDVERAGEIVDGVRASGRLPLLARHEIGFEVSAHLSFLHRSLPYHPNGMRFTALDAQGAPLRVRVYYSVGGGFVVNEAAARGESPLEEDRTPVPYPFHSAAELLAACAAHGLSIGQLMLENEKVFRPEAEIRAGLLRIWGVMQECVRRGLRTEGVLPGGLKVTRRAPALHRRLIESPEVGLRDPLTAMDWVSLYALAVSEENAAGGRVVTAPTNGAAGILPAVLHYYRRFVPISTDDGVVRFLLTAGAIGLLYKENASISGAEVGCQGEVGSACSMAAGALAEALGGTPAQAENAAEIAMEHNLGLTCDPVGGLVQVPCIERNAMAAIKAISAARMALHGDGAHFVSLDKVIKTMRDTGADMESKYKETARGGLAVNVVEAPLGVGVNLPEC